MLKRESKNIDVKFLNPMEYRVGEMIGEDTILDKIYYKNPNYVIFGIRDGKGSPSMGIEYLTVNDDKFNTYAISVQLNRLNYWLEDSAANCSNYNETIADAIALCFRNKENEAIGVLAQLESEVKNEVFKWSKFVYLQSYLLYMLIVIAAIYIFHPTNSVLAKMIALGAIGGLFSIARSIDEYQVEIKGYKNILKTLFGPFLVGVWVRLTVACVGAATSYIVIKSNIIQISGVTDGNTYFMYALGLVSGFSQNFVPSLLTKFETNIHAGEPMQVKNNNETFSKSSNSVVGGQVKTQISSNEQSNEVLIVDDAVG